MYIAVKTNTAVFEGLVELGFEKTKKELKMTFTRTKNKIKLMREADLQSPFTGFPNSLSKVLDIVVRLFASNTCLIGLGIILGLA